MEYCNDIIKAITLPTIPWDSLRGKNILITGSTGLIGSTIVECLMMNPNIDYHVYASGRNKDRALQLFDRFESSPFFHFIYYDVLEPLHSEVCFHYMIACAGLASPQLYSTNPVGVMKSNFCGVDNLFTYGISHCLECFVYISSGEVYGEGDGRVFTEDYSGYVNCATLRACYPTVKRASESLCIAYGNQYGIQVKIARPCHVFGPHFNDNDKRVYAQFIRNILRGEDIVLKSKGEQYRSWCYAVDCAAAILFILLKGENGEAYNIADGRSNLTILELAEMISKIGKCKIRYDIPEEIERRGYNVVKKSIYDATKVENLGWKPLTPIADALYHTIDYLRNV